MDKNRLRAIADEIHGLEDPMYRLKKAKEDARNFILGREVYQPDIDEKIELFQGCIDRVATGQAPIKKLQDYEMELQSAKKLKEILALFREQNGESNSSELL